MADQEEAPISQASGDIEAPEKKRRPRGCAGIFLFFMLILGALWGAVLGGFVAVLDQAQVTIEGLDAWRPKIGSKVYSDDGEVLGEFTTTNRQLLPLNEIPLKLQKAFLSREDDEFYSHKGVNPKAILSAAEYIIRTGNLRGGSTITQQLVRNVEVQGFPDRAQTVRRKLREAIVALQVEREFTKDEILEIYLNQIFLGVSANGVEAAAQQYFGRNCHDLTLAECAMLAGLAKAPNTFEPFSNLEGARQQRDNVLDKMLKDGFITAEEHAAAKAEPLEKSILTREQRAAQAAQAGDRWVPGTTRAPYFVEEVRQEILRRRSKDEVFEGGMSVYTTLDMRLQRAAEEALLSALDEFDAKRLEALKKQGKESEFVQVTGALVCLDNRPGMEGYIRALVGGRDFSKQKYNTVTLAKRQPGSSIKPYVWAAAIDNGMTPSDIEVDEPFVQVLGNNVWRPRNFGEDFSGPVTLRTALEKSINIVSIKLVRKLTVPLVRSYMQRCGITTDISDSVGLTLGLGTPEVTVLDQCVAFSTFAKGGVLTRSTMVKEIQDRDGFTVFKSHIERKRVLPEDLCYVMTYLMQGAATYGTGARSGKLSRPRAGKTGTTNDSRDAWFCGYTPDFTCVVWVGYRDNRPLGRGRDYTGGRLACPIWTDFMIQAEEGMPVKDFPVPDGVSFYGVDKPTGIVGGRFREAFIRGTSPPTEPYVLSEEGSMDFFDEETELLAPL